MSKELPSLRIGKYEIKIPVFQGGMSINLSGSELAAAVANEGGAGTIGGVGLGMSPSIKGQKDFFKANEKNLALEIQKALEISNNGIIGVNLMVATTDYENLVRTAVQNGAKFIVSGAGLPLKLPEYVKKYSTSGRQETELVPIVSSVRAAEIIIKKWKKYDALPTAIIVETPNTAGGHLGVTRVEDIGKTEYSLETIVPNLVKYLSDEGYNIPVIAAGGIWDRTDIDKILNIGASGVQIGTRFLITEECNASEEFKLRHLNNDSNKNPIVVIKSPVGMPGRAIENDFIRRVSCGERVDLGDCVSCLLSCGHRESNFETDYCIVRALDNARRGDENGVFFTGSNGDRLKETGIVSVRRVIQELVGEEI